MQRMAKEIVKSPFTRLNWKQEFIIYKSLSIKAKKYDHLRNGVDEYQMLTNQSLTINMWENPLRQHKAS